MFVCLLFVVVCLFVCLFVVVVVIVIVIVVIVVVVVVVVVVVLVQASIPDFCPTFSVPNIVHSTIARFIAPVSRATTEKLVAWVTSLNAQLQVRARLGVCVCVCVCLQSFRYANTCWHQEGILPTKFKHSSGKQCLDFTSCCQRKKS